MVMCTLLYAVESLCAKLVEVRLPSLELVAFRSTVAGALTLAVSVKAHPEMTWGERLRGPPGFFHLVLLRGVLGGIAFSLLYSSLHFVDVGEQTAIFFTYPLLITTFAWPLLGERAGCATAVALLCGCTGTLLVSRGAGKLFSTTPAVKNTDDDAASRDHAIGLTLTLLASVFTAVTYLTIRVAGPHVSALTLAFAFHLASALIGLGGLALGPQSPAMPSLSRDLPLMCTVACTSLVGQPLLNYSYQALPASRAASLNYLQVFWGFLLGAVFLRERSGVVKLAGALLITAGGICVAYVKGDAGEDDEEEEALAAREKETTTNLTTTTTYRAIDGASPPSSDVP